MPYYQLYHNRATCEIKVTPLKKALQEPRIMTKLANAPENAVIYYNDNYFLSPSRKALRELANVLKTTWLKEVEDEAEKIKSIKI